MGDPDGTARHARQILNANGSVTLVEPMAGNTVEENFNPVGRIYSAASVLVCTPHAIAEGGKALGTIATDAELKAVFDGAGSRASTGRRRHLPTGCSRPGSNLERNYSATA